MWNCFEFGAQIVTSIGFFHWTINPMTVDMWDIICTFGLLALESDAAAAPLHHTLSLVQCFPSIADPTLRVVLSDLEPNPRRPGAELLEQQPVVARRNQRKAVPLRSLSQAREGTCHGRAWLAFLLLCGGLWMNWIPRGYRRRAAFDGAGRVRWRMSRGW